MDSSRRTFRFANGAHLLAHLVMLLYPTVVLALEGEMHRSYGELLALLTAGNVLFGLGAPLAGWLGDRYGASRMMVVFFVGTGVACVATGSATTLPELGLGLASIGLFASVYHPIGVTWLVRDPAGRGRRLGINGIFGSVGAAAAAAFAGVMSDLVSWRAAFLVPGAVSLALGAWLVVELRSGRIVEEQHVRSAPEARPERAQTARAFLILATTLLCTAVTYQAMASAMPKVLAERMPAWVGSGALGAGGLVSVVYLLAALSQVLGGHLADRYSGRHVYAAVYALLVPLLLACARATGAPLFGLLVAAVFLNTIAIPVENVLLAQYAPAAWRGSVYGAKFVLAFGVSGVAVPMVAFLHEMSGGFHSLFWVLGVLVSMVPPLALLLPDPRRQEVAATKP